MDLTNYTYEQLKALRNEIDEQMHDRRATAVQTFKDLATEMELDLSLWLQT